MHADHWSSWLPQPANGKDKFLGAGQSDWFLRLACLRLSRGAPSAFDPGFQASLVNWTISSLLLYEDYSPASFFKNPAIDGLSIAASLVGIGTAGCQIAIRLYTLATQISTASQRISSISNDVALTSGVLKELGEFMTREVGSGGMSIFSQSGLDTTESSAAICESIFNEIEQAAKEASEQLRTRDRFVGKIKLSKSEKAKWPFLQPSIESLRIDLREAKGTLMLMLQVMNLAISQRMATIDMVPNSSQSSHQTTTTDIIEQREIYRAILTLQKQTQGNSSSGKKDLVVDSTSDGTPRAVSSLSPDSRVDQGKESSLVADGEDEIVAKSSLLPDQAAALPSQSPVLIAMPGSDLPDSSETQQPTKEPSNKPPNLRSTKSPDETEHHGMNPTSKESSSRGSNMPSLKSTVDVHREDRKMLHLFALKPYFTGSFNNPDGISLRFVHGKIPMQQAVTQKQVSSSIDNALQPILDSYLQLLLHERGVIDEQVARTGPDAALILLKRMQVDMTYEGIVFKGLPELQYVLESPVKDRGRFEAFEKPAVREIKTTESMDLHRPTYVKTHKQFMSPETLDAYGLPWEWDSNDSNYILIKRWINKDDQDELFEHTRRLRSSRTLTNPVVELKKESGILKLPRRKGWDRYSTLDDMAGLPEVSASIEYTSPSISRRSSHSDHMYRAHSRDPSLERKLEKLAKLEALEQERMDEVDAVSERARKIALEAMNTAAAETKDDISDDSDEVEDWSDGEDAMDDEEAERAVKALLGKYTTLDPSILGGSA
ncbi:MAG: hypothetical protein Q9200_003535 [Gallowayella weberi]